MTGYAELFMSDEERRTQTLPRIVDIPMELVDDFPDHPFKVRMDEDMQQLVESIRERGMITPVILRKKEDGRYEIVSGHRRKKASEIAGLKTIKAEVREMTRDEAIIMMVESNLQRSVILPSEKAFSYKMRLDATQKNAPCKSSEKSWIRIDSVNVNRVEISFKSDIVSYCVKERTNVTSLQQAGRIDQSSIVLNRFCLHFTLYCRV